MDEKNKYTAFYSKQFSSEFENYPQDQQDKVLEFIHTYMTHGLNDFSKYEGKISPSWNVPSSDPEYSKKMLYARGNALWHYHVGLPAYTQIPGVPYKTSDWVLHFQWHDSFAITLVDMYRHYTHDGIFYMPRESYLVADEDV